MVSVGMFGGLHSNLSPGSITMGLGFFIFFYSGVLCVKCCLSINRLNVNVIDGC